MAFLTALPVLLAASSVVAVEDVDGSYGRLPTAFRAQADVVADRMRDPGSTQFKGLFLRNGGMVSGHTTLCGVLNTKNAFGGYVGFDVFAISYPTADGPPILYNAMSVPPDMRPFVREQVLKACTGASR